MNVFQTSKVVTGAGCLKDLGSHAESLGTRVMLVAGSGGSLEKAGVLDRVRDGLTARGLELVEFNRVEPEPSLNTVENGINACADALCDLVIGIGGGSAIDAAKAIAGISGGSVSLHDAFYKGLAIDSSTIPCIAIPTTAGTGAEVTFNSVLTDSGTDTKLSIRGKALLPDLAIVDPELTVSMPPKLTAHTGMDALTQAIESYMSKGASPVTDSLALHAIELVGRSLIKAYADGKDIKAREDVAYGSLLAGIALANARLGAVHGLAHAIGAHCRIPHGLVCAVLLPHILRFNRDAARDKMDRAAKILGQADLVSYVEELNEKMGVPSTFKGLGLKQDLFDLIVKESMPSGSLKANPRTVSENDIMAILKRVS